MEVAPTMFGDWNSLFSGIASIPFSPVAIQSCFFGTSHNLYSDRDGWISHLDSVAALSRRLGCKYLVLGSPLARFAPPEMLSSCGRLSAAEIELGRAIADVAQRNADIVLGLEANPTKYGANTATNAESAARVVRLVNRDNVAFHIDTGCLRVAGDDPLDALNKNDDIIMRGHISMPDLIPYNGSEAAFIKKAIDLGIGLSYEARPNSEGRDGARSFIADVEAALL